MKKFLAMLTMAAVMFAAIGCGGDAPKAKEKETKPAEKTDKDGKKS